MPMLNFASWYDYIFEGVLGTLRKNAARLAPLQPGLKVLDIGCGTGSQLRYFSDNGYRIYGIDLSQPMLGLAKSKLGENAFLAMGNALRIPFPAQTFDLVICSLFVHQLAPALRSEMLIETSRVIKPSGQFLLVDFHVLSSRSFRGSLTYTLISTIEFMAGWEHFSNSRDFLDRGGIPPLAMEHQWRIQESIVVGNGNLGIYLLNRDN
jgi:ubiquinone/menaquinone biosynthesis C-methylase UbiE